MLATAAYAAFGSPETVQPGHRLNEYDIDGRVLVADAAGRAMVLSIDNAGQRVVVLDRCGTGWTPTPVSPTSADLLPIGLAVTPGGMAMAVWQARVGGTDNVYSSVRPPGGSWGTPELIVADNTNVRFGLSDAGDAVAAYSAAGATWTRTRPAGGTWQAPENADPNGGFFQLAVAPNGDAFIGTYSVTDVQAYYRPAGGSWSGPEQVAQPGVQLDGVLNGPYMDIEFTGTGTAVMAYRINISSFITMWGATRGGGWSTHILDNDNVNMAEPKLVRHPNGVVAMWRHAPNISNVDIGVARYGGAWEAKKVYDMPTYFVDYDAAANSSGQILFAAQLDHGPNERFEDIYGATVPSISAPWPDLTLLSPASNGTTVLQRGPHAAAGGTDFFLGWSIHGGPDSSQAIATNTIPACAGAPPTPTPTPTATATATATPQPLPLPQPQPQPQPQAKQPPSAIGGFVTISSGKRCAGTLTMRFKRPRDFPVKKIVVKFNSTRRATVTGAKLARTLTLKRVTRRAFTLSLEVSLADGRTVKGTQRFRACR